MVSIGLLSVYSFFCSALATPNVGLYADRNRQRVRRANINFFIDFFLFFFIVDHVNSMNFSLLRVYMAEGCKHIGGIAYLRYVDLERSMIRLSRMHLDQIT